MHEKVDLKRELAGYRARTGHFDILTVPPGPFLMIDGSGDPNTSPAYADALATLYPVAYTLKFLSKNELGRDYVVMPLEGLWWSDDMASFTAERDKSRWEWTLLNRLPDWIGNDEFATAVDRVQAKGKAPALPNLRREHFSEGLVVQTLHIGPYDDEAATLKTLHETFIPNHDLRMTGKHHEVYLSDPRRAAPERLKTILRQPVVRAS